MIQTLTVIVAIVEVVAVVGVAGEGVADVGVALVRGAVEAVALVEVALEAELAVDETVEFALVEVGLMVERMVVRLIGAVVLVGEDDEVDRDEEVEELGALDDGKVHCRQTHSIFSTTVGAGRILPLPSSAIPPKEA